VNSSGLQWIPVALLSGQIGWYNAQSSPVQSTGLDINTLSGVTSVLIVINYNKKAKILYILNRIKSLTIL